jgi:hypothetical protein
VLDQRVVNSKLFLKYVTVTGQVSIVTRAVRGCYAGPVN